MRGVTRGVEGLGERSEPPCGTEAAAGPLSRWLGPSATFVELVAAPGAPVPWGFAVAAAVEEFAAAPDSSRAGAARPVAIVDGGGGRGLPAAWAAIGLTRATLIRPRSDRDRLWAIERCLRCDGLAATAAFLPAGLDPVAARRLALAAEAGRGLGWLIRPAAAATEPCWADVRLEVAPAPGPGVRERDSPRLRWRLRTLRRRGAAATDELERGVIWELTDDARLASADPLPVAAGLADPAGTPRRGRVRTAGFDRPADGRRRFARAG